MAAKFHFVLAKALFNWKQINKKKNLCPICCTLEQLHNSCFILIGLQRKPKLCDARKVQFGLFAAEYLSKPGQYFLNSYVSNINDKEFQENPQMY